MPRYAKIIMLLCLASVLGFCLTIGVFAIALFNTG